MNNKIVGKDNFVPRIAEKGFW